MKRLGLALLLGLLASDGARAQNFTMPPPAGVSVGGFVVVPSCGGQSLSTTQGFGTMDQTGKLCVNDSAVSTIGSEYPTGAVQVQGSATGTTSAITATLAATASQYNFVCGISIRANATGAATNNATLSDGTKTFNFTQWTAPLASGLGVVEEIFKPCYPTAATNTAWTLTSGAPGSGGVVSASIWGYQKPTTP